MLTPVLIRNRCPVVMSGVKGSSPPPPIARIAIIPEPQSDLPDLDQRPVIIRSMSRVVPIPQMDIVINSDSDICDYRDQILFGRRYRQPVPVPPSVQNLCIFPDQPNPDPQVIHGALINVVVIHRVPGIQVYPVIDPLIINPDPNLIRVQPFRHKVISVSVFLNQEYVQDDRTQVIEIIAPKQIVAHQILPVVDVVPFYEYNEVLNPQLLIARFGIVVPPPPPVVNGVVFGEMSLRPQICGILSVGSQVNGCLVVQPQVEGVFTLVPG
jgi:hypothetical protein